MLTPTSTNSAPIPLESNLDSKGREKVFTGQWIQRYKSGKKVFLSFKYSIFLLLSLFLMTSCAKKQVTVGEAGPPPDVEKEEPLAPEPMDTETFRQEQADRMAAARERETTERERAAAKRLRDEIRSFENENIYFDFDKSELKPEARAVLGKKAEWLKNNPEYSVRIEGN